MCFLMTMQNDKHRKYTEKWTIEPHPLDAGIEPPEITQNLIEYPDAMLLHTTQLGRELPKQLNLFDINFPLSRRKDSARITGSITMQEVYDQLPNLTHEDMLFYIGISRLWNEGYKSFTPQLVYRYAIANKSARVTAKQKQQVVDSLNKMRSMYLTIDVTPEYVGMYKKMDIEEIMLDENLVYIRGAKVTMQGRTYEGYELLKQPVLDRYAQDLKQVTYFTRDLLEGSGGTEDALLNKYMAERLASMENSRNSMASNRILLTSIYEAMDVHTPNKDKRRKIKNKIDSLLASWKNKGRITTYEFVKKGKAFHAVDIGYKKH